MRNPLCRLGWHKETAVMSHAETDFQIVMLRPIIGHICSVLIEDTTSDKQGGHRGIIVRWDKLEPQLFRAIATQRRYLDVVMLLRNWKSSNGN